MIVALNSYFSGAGLMDLGLRMAGVAPQQSFELDQDCRATLRANFHHEVITCDIREKLVASEKDCEAMVATYPCNRYSKVSNLHGTQTGDDLFLHFFRHVAIKQPELYVIENVPGMRKFPVVMEAMTKLPSYFVNVFCPVSAQLWLPQKRDRLIIVGSRRQFIWREPESLRRVSLRSIIEKEPEVEIPEYVERRLDGAYRDLPIISDPERGDIAPTCVAHYSRDLSTRLVVDKRFPRGVRPYSVREYARLQGVPDSFVFKCSSSKAYQMIGNGVAVPMAKWVGSEIKRYFTGGSK